MENRLYSLPASSTSRGIFGWSKCISGAGARLRLMSGGNVCDVDACFAMQVHLDEAVSRTNTASSLRARLRNHIRQLPAADGRRLRARESSA